MIIKHDAVKERNKQAKQELDQLLKKSKSKAFDEIMEALEEYDKDTPERIAKDSFDE